MAKRKHPDLIIDDDEWVTIAWRNQREKCCDCGLTHVASYRVAEDGSLQFKASRLPKRGSQ